MNISFSTIDEHRAKEYFSKESYNWLPQAAKDEALKHLGEGKLRVQDPMMYSKPVLEISTQEIYDKIMGLVK